MFLRPKWFHLSCGVVWCCVVPSVVWSCVVSSGVVFCCVVLCCVLWCCAIAVWCSVMLCDAVCLLCGVVLCSVVTWSPDDLGRAVRQALLVLGAQEYDLDRVEIVGAGKWLVQGNAYCGGAGGI